MFNALMEEAVMEPIIVQPRNQVEANAFKSYKLFTENWDEFQIEHKKQLKVMLKFENNEIEIIDVPLIQDIPLEQGIAQIDSKYILEQASQKNAEEIILAENAPFNNLNNNTNIERILKNFNVEARAYHVKASDYLVLSQFGYYSYRANQ